MLQRKLSCTSLDLKKQHFSKYTWQNLHNLYFSNKHSIYERESSVNAIQGLDKINENLQLSLSLFDHRDKTMPTPSSLVPTLKTKLYIIMYLNLSQSFILLHGKAFEKTIRGKQYTAQKLQFNL